MKRLVLLGLASLALLTGSAVEAAERKARLRIVAPADMPFRTLYLSPGAFNGSRTWTLAPGGYVVVQAPPVSPTLTVRCSNGRHGHGLITLSAGDDVTCTFSVP